MANKNLSLSLRCSDAKSAYADLIEAGHSRKFSFELNKLFDLLHFSAYEMWLKSSEMKYSKINPQEVCDMLNSLPADAGSWTYGSDRLTSELLKIYNTIALKDFNDQTSLESHLYQSISKELFCYRAGHPLVKAYKKPKK